MKMFKITAALLLALCLCLSCVSALAATEADARALMEECGIGDAVADSDNLMGMSLKEVRFDKDNDVYVQWQFDNDMMRSNLGYAFTQMRFFDPADLSVDEMRQIVRFACTAASLSTQTHGGISSVPAEADVEAKMNEEA